MVIDEKSFWRFFTLFGYDFCHSGWYQHRGGGSPKEHFEHYGSWDPSQLLCFSLIDMVISSLLHGVAAKHAKFSLLLSNHLGKTSHSLMVVSNQLLTYCKVKDYSFNHFRDSCQEFILAVCSIWSSTKMTELCWEYWTDLPSADHMVS